MNGNWICTLPEVETPLFRRRFSLNRSTLGSAVLDICGLGYFHLTVNGREVSQDRFMPAQTNYGHRDLSKFLYPLHDRLSTRALYLTYDLTDFLKDGENTLEIILGNGWFRQKERICECKETFYPSLVLKYELRITDQGGNLRSISSDGSETAFVYPILESNLFLGEVTDTRGLDAPLPEVPVQMADFDVPLSPQSCPGDRIIRRISPTLLKREGNLWLFDAGENLSGLVSLRIKGDRGERVHLEYAEDLKNGALRFDNIGGDYICASGRPQVQADTFILSGSEQTLCPMFVFHGFRYFTVECITEDFTPTVLDIHTDLPVTASFRCDDEVINWLYDSYLRSQLSNFHGCIPSDCPHRERLGYTGDGQACAEAAMLTLHAKDAYRKWIDDILDCQNLENGHIQHTAPFMGGGGGPGGWGCAVAIVPHVLYERYGDPEALLASYPAICRWISYLEDHSDGHLVVREEEGGWCLGDWCTPDPIALPEPFVNTCFFIRTCEIAAVASRLLGDGMAESLIEKADLSREALAQAYFDGSDYCGGGQGANAYAIMAALPHHEALYPRLRAHYEALGRLDTGFLGTDILIKVLFDHGMGDLAMALLASRDEKIGFAMMKHAGATTLYENLNTDRYSLNHPMFGACVRNLFTGLLGIRNRAGSVGYTDVVLSPCLNSHIHWACGSICAGEGDLSVSFSVKENGSEITVTVPAGVKAALLIEGTEHRLSVGTQRFEV